eukprot:CAMPEP_0114557012 /NCGR_PEP_ID=MMETSP0114-20121206/9597_1 /TAXON_ID=31324 /ORGANISM="Goniomonas sp, Strain m" /LENGTH=110 /DNA_ID=CAMNT_0001742259 /DNA_START=102 /DNA_END=435 /DNA_ORIENTATION=+
MPQGIVASPPVALQEMAADHGPLTLGEARQLAQAIPEEMRRRFGCRCYKVMCAQEGAGAAEGTVSDARAPSSAAAAFGCLGSTDSWISSSATASAFARTVSIPARSPALI